MTRLRFEHPVTLVGGGPMPPGALEIALQRAPVAVAADSGADTLAARGIRPDMIVGDMDSMRSTPPPGVPLHRIAEQDTTDFEKCLLHTDAPFYLGVGFSAGRLDHALAALHTLIANAERRVILIGSDDIAFAAPGAFEMASTLGMRVSVFPLSPCRALHSRGLRWPLDGLQLAAGRQIGTSNVADAERIAMSFAEPGAVILLPVTSLDAALHALTA